MSNISEKNYLSSKDAGAILGYTHDYISRLCRQGKMSGIQKGREWFVTQEALNIFKAQHEIELAEKKKELSKKFSQIRKEAEAKKRKAREQIKQSGETKFHKEKNINPHKVKFKIPKQLIAAISLFISIMIPSFITSPQTQNSLLSFTKTYEQAVEDTIYAQSTILYPTASVWEAIPYGTELFFSHILNLPHEVYLSMYRIGEGYLTIYVWQGEALNDSFKDLNTLGATVLVGYELIGESFWRGSQDILARFTQIFSENTVLRAIVYFPKNYVRHVVGGYQYVKEDAKQSIALDTTKQATTVAENMRSNVVSNISAISNTVSNVSGATVAYIGSLFEFNLNKKDSRIKAIELKN